MEVQVLSSAPTKKHRLVSVLFCFKRAVLVYSYTYMSHAIVTYEQPLTFQLRLKILLYRLRYRYVTLVIVLTYLLWLEYMMPWGGIIGLLGAIAVVLLLVYFQQYRTKKIYGGVIQKVTIGLKDITVKAVNAKQQMSYTSDQIYLAKLYKQAALLRFRRARGLTIVLVFPDDKIDVARNALQRFRS